VGEQGPDHEKEFHARVVVGEEVLGEGRGRSKKEAEQKAAKQAWHALERRRIDADASLPQG
jgi:ribonuclease-3